MEALFQCLSRVISLSHDDHVRPSSDKSSWFRLTNLEYLFFDIVDYTSIYKIIIVVSLRYF